MGQSVLPEFGLYQITEHRIEATTEAQAALASNNDNYLGDVCEAVGEHADCIRKADKDQGIFARGSLDEAKAIHRAFFTTEGLEMPGVSMRSVNPLGVSFGKATGVIVPANANNPGLFNQLAAAVTTPATNGPAFRAA